MKSFQSIQTIQTIPCWLRACQDLSTIVPGDEHICRLPPLHLRYCPSLVGPRAAFTAVWCRESLRELCLEILSPCQAQFIAYFDICKIDSSVIKRAKILLWIIYNLHLFHSDSSTATLDDLPHYIQSISCLELFNWRRNNHSTRRLFIGPPTTCWIRWTTPIDKLMTLCVPGSCICRWTVQSSCWYLCPTSQSSF